MRDLVELSFEELLDEAMELLDPDSKAFGIARKVTDASSVSELTPKQRYQWDTYVSPAMTRVFERHNARRAKELMEKD